MTQFWKWRPVWWKTPSDRFSGLVAIFTGFSVLVAAIQACLLRNQISEMQTEQRPWIGAPEIMFNRTDTGVAISIVFKNVGHVPTTGFSVDTKFSPWEYPNNEQEAIRLCDSEVQQVHEFNSFSVVPDSPTKIGATHTQGDFTNVPISEIEKVPNPGIVGCVVYGSPFDGVRHKTAFVSSLKPKKDEKGNTSVSADYIYALNAN